MNCLSHSGKTSHAPALSAEKEMLEKPVVYSCCKHHCHLQPLLQLESEPYATASQVRRAVGFCNVRWLMLSRQIS